MKPDYRDLLENMGEGLYFVDAERRITFWNKAAERISGFPSDEVVGSTCFDGVLVHVDARGENLCQGMCPLAVALGERRPHEAELFLHHRQGHRIPVRVRVFPLRDDEGRIVGAAELFTDRSTESLLEARVRELEAMSMLDALTRLANRRFLEQELVRRIAEATRYGLPFGALFLDVDRFKAVNDRYGHPVGDRVLRTVSRSISACCRPFDVFSRWGGEEFLGIVRQVDRDDLAQVADRVRVAVRASVVRERDRDVRVTVSAGGTLFRPGDSPDALVARADALMYRSKDEGGDRVTIG